MATSAPTEADLRRMVETLSPTEQAALPARLRRLATDDETRAWADAKAARDAALEAAVAHVDPDDPDSEFVIADPDERAAAIAAARAAWTEFKKGQG